MQFAGWAYPLEGYFRALEDAGFAIEALREPPDRWRIWALEANSLVSDVARGQNPLEPIPYFM